MADYTHTIDRWDEATGENLIERIAGVSDYLVALEFSALPLQKCLETSKNTNVSLELASITGGGSSRHCKTVGFRRKPYVRKFRLA
jgi:hypothetical protein